MSKSGVRGVDDARGTASVCTSVCTILDEGVIERAIARLTVALTTAADDTIAALVDERRALRAELVELRQAGAGGVRLEYERVRRRPGR